MTKTSTKPKRREVAGVHAVHADIDATLYRRLHAAAKSRKQTIRVVLEEALAALLGGAK